MARNEGKRGPLSGNACAVSYLREIFGTSHTRKCTFLLHPGQGDLQVVVVLQRFSNETLKNGILEQVPPSQIRLRTGAYLPLCIKVGWRLKWRTLILGTHGAASQEK